MRFIILAAIAISTIAAIHLDEEKFIRDRRGRRHHDGRDFELAEKKKFDLDLKKVDFKKVKDIEGGRRRFHHSRSESCSRSYSKSYSKSCSDDKHHGRRHHNHRRYNRFPKIDKKEELKVLKVGDAQ